MFMAFFIAGIAFFSSCKKSSSTSYRMYASINGAAFNGAKCFATSNNTAINIYGNLASDTSATKPAFPYILLSISNFTGTGTYVIGTSGATGAGAIIDSSATHNAIGIYGTITINSVSPNISGSFSFLALDSTSVTNGSFTALAP